MDNWYIIEDLSNFVDHARHMVFNHFGSELQDEDYTESLLRELTTEEQDELDTVLTHDESMIIAKNFVKKQTNKQTKETRYIVSEDVFLEMISSLNDRLVSNLIHNLVKKGLLETAYDDEKNDFVFWATKKDDNSQKNKNNKKTD